MEIPAELQDVLIGLFRERFDDSDISGVTLKSIEIDEKAGEIRIVLEVGITVEPKKFASRFFGLASLVQRKVNDSCSSLDDFFPVITPEFSPEVHA